MTKAHELRVQETPLAPFGRLVTADGPADLRDIAPATLERWTVESKVVVLRGFPLLDKEDLVDYCAQWGEILHWDFGAVLDLVVQEDPKNYLFSRTDVPFHWDGAFAKTAPRYFLFQCVEAPVAGGGGETVFSDSVEVLRRTPEELRREWAGTQVTYRTEKLGYYGGETVSPLLAEHSETGETILRYGEPLDPAKYKNPVWVDIAGKSGADAEAFMTDLRDRMHDPEVCYHHEWQDGDIVAVDNQALLHGRNAFRGNSSRHLQRIQIL
ncbi:TauD/TfdA dioxygenase family protein [Saccharothrix variisporea]|uniref:3-(4-hydroxyphenyl)acrylonitrile synthase n=1 Tax=Saccharothrix variisporea TaxID=543527 RepID=A0A495X7R2_9PSEU|nr:TauD/TfdA family dioxygenase [Saccharothrix variisporea]RKT70210.1 3-(4-hydroxyphenyl)acrylonitrile synthase [Saccharothrix variisporea]